jgi:hypothetical protein
LASRQHTAAFRAGAVMKRHSEKTFAFEIQIRRRVGSAELLGAALDDHDVEAQRTATAIIGWLSRFHRGDPADCFACGVRLVHPIGALVILMPVRRAGRRAIVGGLCSGCCSLSGAALMDGVMVTIRKVMPSAQLLCVPAHGGHA